jgi:NAD(P)H-flavin reductase
MYKIIEKEVLSEAIFRIEVEAPFIAKNRKPGHFVVVRTEEKGERIPLTIVDSDLK